MLAGRRRELARLERAVLALPEGSFVELAGEAGIGKTRLLDELRARADAREMLVLEGRGSEYEADVPFGILVDALDEYLAALDDARLERLAGEAAADLGAVFPSLAGRAGAAGRFRAHRAVALLLERLPPGRGLLLVLDDVHWADEASVEVLAHVLRTPAPRGLVLALAHRARQSPGRLVSARGGGSPWLRRADRARATRPSARRRRCCRDGTDPARAHRLYEASGGNPFYLEQLARAGAVARVAGAAARDELALPAAVVAALAHELDGLPQPARTLLESGALVGEPFEVDLAMAVAEQDAAGALEALDVLLARDLVRPTDVPRRLRFRHPILRRVVYEASRLGWRLGAHARAAAALEARGAPATVLARHVEHAGAHGDERAVDVLAARRRGGDARPRRGRALVRRGATCAAGGRRSGRRVTLLAHWAFSRAVTGNMEEGHAAMVEALTSLPEGEVEARTSITAFCAATEHFMGRHEQAHDRLVAALPWIPPGGSPAAAAIAVELAGDAFLQGDAELLRSWAARGVELAAEAGEPLLEAAATVQLAFAALHEGDPAASRRLRDEGCRRIDALSDEWIVDRVSIAYYLGVGEHYLEHDGDAERHLERALAAAHETGKTFILAPAGATLAQAKLRLGRVAEAADAASDAVDAATLTGNRQSLMQALAAHARALLAAGDVRLAVAAAQESVRESSRLERSAYSGGPALALGAALLEAGQPAEAAVAVRSTAGLPLVPGTTGCEAHEMLVRAALATGRRDDASRGPSGRWRLPSGPSSRWRAPRPGRPARSSCSTPATRAAPSRRQPPRSSPPRRSARFSRPPARACSPGPRWTSRATGRARVTTLRAAQAALESAGARRLRDACDRELRRLGERVHRRAVQARGRGPGGAQQPRARDRAARPRPQDEPRDRRRAVPEREDRGKPPAQRVREAGRVVAARRRRRGRALHRATLTKLRATAGRFRGRHR